MQKKEHAYIPGDSRPARDIRVYPTQIVPLNSIPEGTSASKQRNVAPTRQNQLLASVTVHWMFWMILAHQIQTMLLFLCYQN